MREINDQEVINFLKTMKGGYNWNHTEECPGAMLLQHLYPDAGRVSFGYGHGRIFNKDDNEVERVGISDKAAEALVRNRTYERALAQLEA